MTIRDWVELTLLVVVTLLSIGRWLELRQVREGKALDGVHGALTQFHEYQARHGDEHARLWKEIERQRRHWHEEMVPWQQGCAGRLATLEAQQAGHTRELTQLWAALERRRETRGDD